jgi:hypothetical protein
MAQVVQAICLEIDRLLELLFAQWGRLPEVESEIDTWDWEEQVVFIEEWPIEEDRLAELERLAAGGLLTAQQLDRYAELRALVERNRPILRRLQEG